MKQLSIDQELRVSANNTCVYETGTLSLGLVTATELEYIIEQLEDVQARMIKINGALEEVKKETLKKMYEAETESDIPF